MGITNTTRKIVYVGNGSTTLFSFPFKVYATNQLRVVKLDITDNSTEVLVLGVGFTATLNDGEGGSITTSVAPTSDERLFIISNVPFTQPDNISRGPTPSSTIEQIADRVTILSQQINSILDRVPKLSESTLADPVALPDPVEDNFLIWDANGDLVNTTVTIPDGSIIDGQISQGAAIALDKLATLTPNRAVVTDGDGYVDESDVTSTELGYLDGVTSSIQTQLDGKLSTTHTSDSSAHAADDIDYDNSTSNLTATNVRLALDEVSNADGVTYDNVTSGLTASNVQDAIDEIDLAVDDLILNKADAVDIVDKTYFTTKGDLLVATGNGTYQRVGVGTDGQYLTAASSQTTGVGWTTGAAGVTELNDLTDVDLTGLATNDLLKYNGSAFVPYTSGGLLGAVQIITTPGANTWNKPTGLKFIRVFVVGGGAGGGGADGAGAGSASAASGGGAGGTVIKIIPAASLGSSETVTIGSGGSGGTGSGGGSGGSGGESSFGAHCATGQAQGGSGDTGSTTIGPGKVGRLGGVPTGGINIRGESSRTGLRFANYAVGGAGGSSLYGSGGADTRASSGAETGNAAQGYGGGGGGASSGNTASNANGGDGTSGICIVEEYF